jgi:hypothetical protein
VSFAPSGIESPEIRSWHKLDPPQNTISLTGASHTRQAYLALEEGWSAGPPGIWTDLYMWVKFFRNSEVSTFTSPFTTTIKLLYDKETRELLTREEIIKRWYQVTIFSDKLAKLQRRIQARFRLSKFLWHNMASIRRLKTTVETFLKSN